MKKATAPAAGPLDAWQRLMAIYDQASAAYDDVNARFDAAAAAYEADKPAEPDVDMVLLFGSLMGRCDVARRRLIHRDDLDEMQRRILAAKGVTRWERVDRDPQRIAEFDKVREYRRLLAEADERHQIPALENEWTEAGNRVADAQTALLLAPAPDYAAIRWKLDRLFGDGTAAWDREFTDAVIADMARLAGEPDADRRAA